MTLWLELILDLINCLNFSFDYLLSQFVSPLGTRSDNRPLYQWLESFVNLTRANIHSEEDRISKSIDIWIEGAKLLTK
jgi:hypothetical protein